MIISYHLPIVFLPSLILVKILAATKIESHITHLNAISVQTAQCMNVILRELIKGKSYSEALGTAKNMEGNCKYNIKLKE